MWIMIQAACCTVRYPSWRYDGLTTVQISDAGYILPVRLPDALKARIHLVRTAGEHVHIMARWLNGCDVYYAYDPRVL